jgi:hypothetical protein
MKRVSSIPCKTKLANFESPWFKTIAFHKFEASNMVLRNWVENPQKNKNPKNLHFHSLKGHQVGGGMR